MSLKPLKTLFCWFSRRFCWFYFVCLVFSKDFGFVKNLRENKTNKQNKPISKGESETFKNFVLLVFPKVLLVFFGCLLYFWFSRMFCWFCKNLRENQQKQTKTNISKGESETFKNFGCLVFPNIFWVFFGFLWYCWFSRRFFGFCKNLRENQKTF